MAVQSEHVIDVADFDRDVIARSAEVPVLVDFWAPWCGPCRALGPVLEKLAVEMRGAFVLAKVNVDENQAAAARFKVHGIPDVKLFVAGKVVDQFVGALPEDRVRAFVRKHCPSEADRLVGEGDRALEAGDKAAAREAFERALAVEPECHAALLAIARMALAHGDIEAIRQHTARIPPRAAEWDTAKHLEQAAALLADVTVLGTEAALRERLAANPRDIEAHYGLGVYLLAGQHYRDALDSFLAVAEQDRKWRDEAARKAMLTTFGLLGVRHPISDEYRRKLMFIY